MVEHHEGPRLPGSSGFSLEYRQRSGLDQGRVPLAIARPDAGGRTTYVLNYWRSSHYGGAFVAVPVRAWSTGPRSIGPFFLYINSGGDPQALWQGTRSRARRREAGRTTGSRASIIARRSDRAEVTGQLVLNDPQKPKASTGQHSWLASRTAAYARRWPQLPRRPAPQTTDRLATNRRQALRVLLAREIDHMAASRSRTSRQATTAYARVRPTACSASTAKSRHHRRAGQAARPAASRLWTPVRHGEAPGGGEY